MQQAQHVYQRDPLWLARPLRRPEFRNVPALALASKCAACDREFGALAREAGGPLVTSDQLVLSVFPETAVSPERFLLGGAR